MSQSYSYEENKPFFHSLLLGLLYFFLGWSLRLGDGGFGGDFTILLLLFLPGMTFPLSTSYFGAGQMKHLRERRVLHCILSVVVYFGCLVVYLNLVFQYNIIASFLDGFLAGFSGSLVYLLTTKYLLKKKLKWTQILLTAILSGLVFLPGAKAEGFGIWLGIALFLWTLINGFLLNMEYKKSTAWRFDQH